MKRYSRAPRAGWTLVELMVVVVLVAVVVALLVPAFARSSRQEKVEACAANLKALHQAQQAYYAASHVSPDLGRGYWEKLMKMSPPLLQPQTLLCPVFGREAEEPVQYMGPTSDPAKARPDDP